MKIAYLVNQYPTVSHSFIRREILALEALGISITRFSHRSCAEKIVDKADQQEFLKTNVLGGTSYSFTVHGPEEFDNVRGIALTEKIKRATFVIAVSSFCRSQLYRWCEYSEWSKINQVGYGLDEGFFSIPWQSITDDSRFVCVGRLSEQKGQLMLIEAAGRLLAEGFMFKLVLVGDGSFREQIETAITNSRLEETVEITGWATEAQVQQQILADRAMVLPSFAEGLPVVIMESLALGRPVISTYVAGIPELVEPNLSGWLIPAGSVEALVTAMRIVLQTPVSQLEQMGEMGRQRVAQQHNIQQNAEKLAHLFTINSLSYS